MRTSKVRVTLNENNRIDTSIVIATCSRAGMLRNALQTLLREASSLGVLVELVVVDDGSTDETPQVLAEFQNESTVPISILTGERRGVAAARNLGAQHAAGTWLASFDDDQLALPGWLASLRKRADDAGAVCVGGALELSLPEGHAVAELGPRVRRILGEHRPSPVATSNGAVPASNNVLIRRDVFWDLGGYDTSFTEGAEDADLFDRMTAAGYALWFEPLARALHIIPEARLQPDNLRWTSLRIGASDARRLTRRGRLPLLKVVALRLTVSALRDAPQLLWAGLSQNRRLLRDAQCSLWYTLGLLRALPVFFFAKNQSSAFLQAMDFRSRNGERREATVRSEPGESTAERP